MIYISIYYIYNNLKKKRILTTEGFEPSPLRNSALNYRLRPLGQIVIVIYLLIFYHYKSKFLK